MFNYIIENIRGEKNELLRKYKFAIRGPEA